jgi:hypothetical protein
VARIAANVQLERVSPYSSWEIVYNKTFVLVGAAEDSSGTYESRFWDDPVSIPTSGTGTWTAKSTNGGTHEVTVPAGTFTTTRWNWVWQLSGDMTHGTSAESYAVDPASEVRRVATETGWAYSRGSYSLELIPDPAATMSKTQARAQAQVGGMALLLMLDPQKVRRRH